MAGTSASTALNPEEDADSTCFRAARAVLITAHAISEANGVLLAEELVDKAAPANATNPFAVRSELAKFFSTLDYLKMSGESTRWTTSNGGFRDVLDRSYAIQTFNISEPLKHRVRGEFKCSLCGQVEEHCHVGVHFAGVPTVERGAKLPPYSAKAFNTSNLEKLADAYSNYAESYNEATAFGDDQHDAYPVSHYLGVVLPGQTCLRRLLTSFSAQDLVRSVFDEVYEHNKTDDAAAFPFEALERSRVSALASRIDQLFTAIQRDSKAGFANSDDEFWTETLQRFSTAKKLPANNTFELLRAGYVRMEQNVKKVPLSVCLACEEAEKHEEEEEEVGAVRRSRRSHHKRKVTITIDSDDDDLVEEEEDDDDGDDGFIVNDEEEDEEEEAEEEDPAEGRKRRRWGETSASAAGPFAQRRKPVHEPFAPAAASAAQRRERGRTTEVVLADSEATNGDPIFEALKTVTKHTARGLRAHPNNSIGSRRSTLAKLGGVATWLLTDGDLTAATRALRALSTLAEVLDAHERSCAGSDADCRQKLAAIADQCLGPILKKLLCDGFVEHARSVAEATILAHELLGA
jgi:hypothetical protein